MPGLMAIIGGNAQPLQREFKSVEAMAARAGVNIQRGLAGAHGGVNSAAMRELLVLVREISAGNWTRVPGSLSILIGRLGYLKYLFSLTAGVIVSAGAAAYFFWQHIKQVNEELDRTGTAFEKGFGNMAKSMQEASKEAASAAADFNDWLNNLSDSHDTLADKTAETIRLMREEARLQREASGDKSKKSELKSEAEERKKELDIITRALLEQRRIVEESQSKARAENEAAFTGTDAKKRLATLRDLPGQISDNDADLKKFKEIQKQLLKKVEDSVDVPGSMANPALFAKDLADQRERLSGQSFSVGPKGQEEQFSLNQVNDLIKKYEGNLMTMDAEQVRLTAVQRELSDALRDGKKRTEKENHALEQLTKERDGLTADIALHQKYDAQTGLQRATHGSVNALQQVGAYTAPATMEVIAHKQLHHLRSIDNKIDRIGGGGAGGHRPSGQVQF